MPQSSEAEQRLLVKRIAQLKQRDFIPVELLDIVEKVYTRQITARAQTKFKNDKGEVEVQVGDFVSVAIGSIENGYGDTILSRDTAKRLASWMSLEKALESGELVPDSAFEAFFAEDEDFFTAWAERTPDAPRTVLFLTQSSLAPSIASVARTLAEKHDTDTVWTHQHCPVCGGLPLIAELRDKAGRRYASCSFCGTRYRIPRLACAFCGETDAKRLSYFTAEDETGYRVEVCQSCKLYLKATDFRELDKDALPLIDDLESLALDILAGNEGFKRPTLSGLGF